MGREALAPTEKWSVCILDGRFPVLCTGDWQLLWVSCETISLENQGSQQRSSFHIVTVNSRPSRQSSQLHGAPLTRLSLGIRSLKEISGPKLLTYDHLLGTSLERLFFSFQTEAKKYFMPYKEPIPPPPPETTFGIDTQLWIGNAGPLRVPGGTA